MPYYNRPSALNYMLELEEEERWSHHLQLKNDAMAVEVGPGAISAGPRKYYVGWRHTLSTIPSSLSSKMLQINKRKKGEEQTEKVEKQNVCTYINFGEDHKVARSLLEQTLPQEGSCGSLATVVAELAYDVHYNIRVDISVADKYQKVRRLHAYWTLSVWKEPENAPSR